MKGKIITETVYEGWLAYSHGMGYEIKRIIVPEADNLAVALHDNQLYIFTGFEEGKRKDFKILKEIEVPDEFVKKAIAFLKTKEELACETKTLLGEFFEKDDEEG